MKEPEVAPIPQKETAEAKNKTEISANFKKIEEKLESQCASSSGQKDPRNSLIPFGERVCYKNIYIYVSTC